MLLEFLGTAILGIIVGLVTQYIYDVVVAKISVKRLMESLGVGE